MIESCGTCSDPEDLAIVSTALSSTAQQLRAKAAESWDSVRDTMIEPTQATYTAAELLVLSEDLHQSLDRTSTLISETTQLADKLDQIAIDCSGLVCEKAVGQLCVRAEKARQLNEEVVAQYNPDDETDEF